MLYYIVLLETNTNYLSWLISISILMQTKDMYSADW